MNKQQRYCLQAVVVIAVVIIGYVTLRGSFASTAAVATEPEAANTIGNTQLVTDSRASGGQDITFGTAIYGPQPATKPTGAIMPEQYGAVGDGVHDDATAIDNALAAANTAGGGTVWLSANKTYLISSKSVVAYSNTTLAGAGPTAVLKFTWGTPGTATTANQGSYIRNKNMNPGSTDSNITYKNFVMEGAGNGLPSGGPDTNPEYNTYPLTPSLRAGYVTNLTATHLEIRNSPGLSVSYHNSKNVQMTYNYVHNSGRDGITGFWDPPDTGYAANVLVANNYISDVGDDAIALNGLPEGSYNVVGLPYNMTVENNIIKGWDHDPNGKMLGRGIALAGVAYVSIHNNSIVNTSYHSPGILVAGCTSTFCEPTSQGTSHDPDGLPWKSNNITITGNTMYNVGGIPTSRGNGGNSDSVFYIINALNTTIDGNRVVNPYPSYTFMKLSSPTDCLGCTLQQASSN